MGLLAHEVEDAIDHLAIGNASGSKWHEGAAYKTLDHSRLVAVLIHVVNQLSPQVKELQSKVDGATECCRD